MPRKPLTVEEKAALFDETVVVFKALRAAPFIMESSILTGVLNSSYTADDAISGYTIGDDELGPTFAEVFEKIVARKRSTLLKPTDQQIAAAADRQRKAWPYAVDLMTYVRVAVRDEVRRWKIPTQGT